MRIAGVILAGGASSRMGAPKPLMPFRGAMLIDAVIACAATQVETLAINVACEDTETYRTRFPQTILPDLFSEKHGPLCGIVTGLQWLDADWLATFPCDTPFLPHDLVAQLAKHANAHPVVAKGAQVCGLWPKSCLARLKTGIESGELRTVLGAVEFFGGSVIEIEAPEYAFFNINTPEDLAEALRLSA